MIANCKPINQNTETSTTPVVSFLDIDGRLHEETPVLFENRYYVSKNDNKSYGKIEAYGDDVRYFLKQYRGGRPGELLVDPYGMHSKAEDMSAYLTQRGHRFCEYIQVNEQVFNTYVSYLHSRNPIHFRHCEKEILNRVL